MKEAEGSATPSRASRPRVTTLPPSKLDLLPGQFFGVVYDLQGELMGRGIMSDYTRQVAVEGQTDVVNTASTARAPVRRKKRGRFGKPVAYIGKRRPSYMHANSTKVAPILSSTSSAQSEGPHERDSVAEQTVEVAPTSLLPPRRMYIGDRSALDKGTYVSMDELIQRALREEEEDMWGRPLSDPPLTDGREGVMDVASPARAQHSALDVQYAIALAFHRLQTSPKNKTKVAAADVARL